MPHEYTLVSAHGEDAPNKSLDEYRYCHKCGTLRHDYRHNGGQTSPNFPMFCAVGQKVWTVQEPSCVPEKPDPKATAAPRLSPYKVM